MAIKKNEIYSSLWASRDKLRGGMDASQYKDYILTLLFVKYVTDKFKGVKYADITVPEGGSFDDMVALKGSKNIEADGLWCAAFVLYCCREAGFEIPYRPNECKTCHLAACFGWEEFAINDHRIEYHKGTEAFVPKAGDIVIYDRVFENREHDHMGIVLEKREHALLAAEGNVNNISGIIERPIDEHIRAYIRIPDGYQYRAK